jgi:hypothetical protein
MSDFYSKVVNDTLVNIYVEIYYDTNPTVLLEIHRNQDSISFFRYYYQSIYSQMSSRETEYITLNAKDLHLYGFTSNSIIYTSSNPDHSISKYSDISTDYFRHIGITRRFNQFLDLENGVLKVIFYNY